jgi:hypothetical protein
LLEEDADYLKLDVLDVAITYYRNEIQSIELLVDEEENDEEEESNDE